MTARVEVRREAVVSALAPELESTPRVLIENVSPAVDGGRYPVKRLVGDVLVVGADVIAEGHDVLAAGVCWRAPDDEAWRHAPMKYDPDTDRFTGTVPLDRLGRWQFTVEAWRDAFATW